MWFYMKFSLDTSIVCTYKRPQKSLRDFVNEFDNILTQVNGRCFVVGDFNVSLLEYSKQNLLISLMHRHGFTHVKKTNNRQRNVAQSCIQSGHSSDQH